MEQYENLKCNPNSRLIRDFQFSPTYGMLQVFLLFRNAAMKSDQLSG